MDSRRGRNIGEPLVRRVGFVTPGSFSEDMPIPAGAQTSGGTVQHNSPSPVIIPPPRPSTATSSVSQPMPVPALLALKAVGRMDDVGSSFNPESLMATSSSSKASGSNYSSHLEESLAASPQARATGDAAVAGAAALPPRADRDVSAGSVPSPARLATPASQVPASLPAAASTQTVAGDSKPTIPVTAVVPGGAPGAGPLKPKPVLTRAERRAKQEAERAAKAAAKEDVAAGKGVRGSASAEERKGTQTASKAGAEKAGARKDAPPATVEKKGKDGPADKKGGVPAVRLQFDDKTRLAKQAKKQPLVEQLETKNRVELFRHLPQFVYGTQLPSAEAKFFKEDANHPHASVYQVGLRYLTGDVTGANARCIAMLMAFRDLIRDYTTPPAKALSRDLTAKINSHVSFLITCRPLAISMGNAIRWLKSQILKLPSNITEAQAKQTLMADIDKFIQEKIVFADRAIVDYAVDKIQDGDKVLTHGCSGVVEMIFSEARRRGKEFDVVVVDSRPKLEGAQLLHRLLKCGIKCTYTHINALSYIMREVNRVFLGAAAVLANGTVYSRIGSATTAMVAHSSRVPVLICCETYKFHERVQLDSICANELGDPEALCHVAGRGPSEDLKGWADSDNLQLLNLMYDAMPSAYVAMIITELGMIPATSVPVILREYRKESNAIALL